MIVFKGPTSISKAAVAGQENIPDTDDSPVTKECDDRYIPQNHTIYIRALLLIKALYECRVTSLILFSDSHKKNITNILLALVHHLALAFSVAIVIVYRNVFARLPLTTKLHKNKLPCLFTCCLHMPQTKQTNHFFFCLLHKG